MRISELIEKLQEAMAEHGDILAAVNWNSEVGEGSRTFEVEGPYLGDVEIRMDGRDVMVPALIIG